MGSDKSEKHELYNALLFLVGFIVLILAIDYAIYNRLYIPISDNVFSTLSVKLYGYIHDKTFVFRAFYVLLCMGLFYLKRHISSKEHKYKLYKSVLSIFFILLFLFGYGNNDFYNIYIYPFVGFAVMLATYTLFVLLGKGFKGDNIFGLSNEKTYKQLSYFFDTDQGKITFHSGEQHMYVSGGSGAGKSDSILKPTILQHTEMDFPQIIYDFKGNPMTLGRTLYSSYMRAVLEGKKLKTELQFLNFADITRTFRVNPLSDRYITNKSEAITMIANFLKNFNPDWRRKEDLWYRGAKGIWVALIMRFVNDDTLRSKLSFPVLFEILTRGDNATLIAFIEDDRDAKKMLSSVKAASDGSPKQFTGYITSATDMAVNFLSNPDLYWILSSDDVNLDVNNPNNPTALCIASDGKPNSEYTPLVACILGIILEFLGKQGQLPALLQLDEIYTVYLDGLPAYANTFRSNGICMQIGNQLKSMLTDMYGTREKGNNVFGACGTQFFGMGNDNETSKDLVEMLSDINVYNQSLNTSEDSKSVGESLKRQKAMELRDVNGQPTGHFTGKIANGKPPYFSAQFDRYKYHADEIEVPQFVYDSYTEKELKEAIHTNYESIIEFVDDLYENFKVEE